MIRLYTEFSRIRRVTGESQMCHYWDNPTIEVFEGSDELLALETEFGIQIDEYAALDLYDMNLKDAADAIEAIIQEQQGNKLYKSVKVIEDLSPEMAKRILREIWLGSFKGRSYITAAIEKMQYEDKLRKEESASLPKNRSAP